MGEPQINTDWKNLAGSFTEPDVNYHAQWAAYRRRRLLALVLLYAWLPVCAVLFLWSRFFGHQPFLALTGMLILMCAAMWAVWWAGEFRCPRCRRRYGSLGEKKGSSNLTRGIFDEICANCKLRKFEKV